VVSPENFGYTFVKFLHHCAYVWVYLFSPHADRLWGSPSLLFNGYRGTISPGVKRPWRQADHSPPSSADVKNAWSLYLHSAVFLHGVVLS